MSLLTTTKRYWYIPVLTVVLLTAIGVGASLFLPQRYESNLSMLVIQQQKGRFDAYTAARSAQTVSETLVHVLHTSSVQEAVLTNEGFGIDQDALPRDPGMRSAFWENTVQARTANADGTIHIRVLHEDRSQARAIAYSVADTLIEKGGQYHGGGQDIVVRMIDEPTTSLRVVEPNIMRNGLAAAVLGLLLGAGLLVLLEGRSDASQAFIRSAARTYQPVEEAGERATETITDAEVSYGPTYSVAEPAFTVERAHVEVMPQATTQEAHVVDEEVSFTVEKEDVAQETQNVDVEDAQQADAVDVVPETEQDDLFEIPAGIDDEDDDAQDTWEGVERTENEKDVEVTDVVDAKNSKSEVEEVLPAKAEQEKSSTSDEEKKTSIRSPFKRLQEKQEKRAVAASRTKQASATSLQNEEGEKASASESDQTKSKQKEQTANKMSTSYTSPLETNVRAPQTTVMAAPVVQSSPKGEEQVASFKGGLQELRRQMEERKKEREARMQFTGNPIQRAFSAPPALASVVQEETSRNPAKKGSFAEKMQKKLEERQLEKQQKQEEEKEPEQLMDVASTEEWIRTGSFNKS